MNVLLVLETVVLTLYKCFSIIPTQVLLCYQGGGSTFLL